MNSTSKIAKSISDRKQNKKKTINNNVYKMGLMLMVSFLCFIIIAAFAGVIVLGLKAAHEQGIGFFEALFSNTFKPGFSDIGIPGVYGVGLLVVNTLWMSLLALCIAVPVAISTALVITKFLGKRAAIIMFALVSILAAIPSVVYGTFGYYMIDHVIKTWFGFKQGSLFTIIIMIALMIMPTITIMTITSINMVDKDIESSSYALGASKTQTSIYVTLRAAKSGIFLGMLFAIGRALGEATAISMVSASSLVFPAHLNLAPWNISLFLSPLIMMTAGGVITDHNLEFTLYIFLTAILLITVIILFILLRFIQYKTNDEVIAKKQAALTYDTNRVGNLVEENGLEALESKNQRIWISGQQKEAAQKHSYEFYSSPNFKTQAILKQTSLDASIRWIKYKKSKSILHYSVIFIFSLFGIIMLTGIFAYIFNGGFVVDTKRGPVNLLSWQVITQKGGKNYGTDMIYGLAIPLLGTVINIIFCLSIALPIGIATGMFITSYMKKNSWLSTIVSFVFQIMISVPTVVYGAIAIIIFSGTKLDENAKMFEPMIMLVLIILPTIIKQTEEGITKIDKRLIEGSTALGATTLTSSRKIYIKQISPAIISAALLAVSIIIAESAIFITILPPVDEPNDSITGWFSGGGLTLTTIMYQLNGASDPVKRAQIRSIALILMIIVLLLAIVSQLIKNGYYKEAGISLSGFITAVAAILITENGLPILFGFAVVIPIISIILLEFFKYKGISFKKIWEGR